MAVDIALQAPGPGGWVTVVANNGSDVFVQMAATEPRSLLVADNASFQPRLEVPAFNERFDALHVYHGNVVNRNAFDPIHDPTDPALNFGVPQGYPWRNGVQPDGLFFVMQTEGIDVLEPVNGRLDLNNGDPNDTIVFNNLDAAGDPTPTFRIIDGPGTGSILPYVLGSTGGTRPQFTLTFPTEPFFGADVGQTAVPELTLDYDADTGRPGATSRIRRIVSSELGAAVGTPHTFEIFDPTEHQYVPGTLQGTIELVFGPSSVASIDFVISTTDVTTDAGLSVPIGFGPTRGPRGDLGSFLYLNSVGGEFNQLILVTGGFDSLTGVLTVEAGLAIFGAGDNILTAPLQSRPFSTYVTNVSVGLRDVDSTDNAADPTGLLFDTAANKFTLWPGQTFTRSLFVEMVNAESVVTIESPIVTREVQNDEGNSVAGRLVGQVNLAGTRVNVNAPIRADRRFDIPDAENSQMGTVSEMVTVNSIIGSPTFDIRLGNSLLTPSINRGRLTVSQTGSLSNLDNVLQTPTVLPFADEVFVEVVDGDVYIEGKVGAAEQTYLVSSPQLQPDGTSQVGEYAGFVPYMFTTRSRLTGQDVGLLSATTLGITLGNDTIVLPPADEWPPQSPFVPSTAFAVLDISTSTVSLRVQASDRVNDALQQPFPYVLSVRELDDLSVNAVAASSLPIDIRAGGKISLLAALESAGDVRLESAEEHAVGAPISTRFGRIELVAPKITVSNSIRVLDGFQDERLTDIRLVATAGDLILRDAVTAINRIELRATGAPAANPPTNGSISGANRVFADTVEIVATGDVDVRTAATRVIARAPGNVFIDELDYGIFEVRNARNVRLVANGHDQVLKGSEAGLEGDRAYISPALYADIYDTQVLTVSAPNGSVDVLHYGSNTLAVGDVATIDGNRGPSMVAGGSVSIRSTLGAITVFDAPSATGNARQVRLATTAPLGGVYRPNSPGVLPSRLDNVRITRTGIQSKSALELDGVDVTTLRLNDRILVKDGAGGSVVGFLANGIYTIVGINYPVGDTSQMFLNLVRSTDADTTAELAQKHYVRISDGQTLRNQVWTADGSIREGDQPVYRGWGDANEYRFANVFDNRAINVPVQVTPIESRTGYVTAKAVTTVPLLSGASAAIYNHSAGTITSTGNRRVPAFNGVDLRQGELVLVRYGAGNGAGVLDARSPGLYFVDSEGSADDVWILRRYEGIDDDGDGVLDAFFTGRVAINEGSLRTAVTGQMFEISLLSLGFSALRYQPVTEFTGTGEFDPVLNFRTDIGTDNPTAVVQFAVSTESGRNNDTGSLGRMLTLMQANSATNSRTLLPQTQTLGFNLTVSNIRLQQELPPLTRPITISTTRPVNIDGLDIQTSWDGNVIRSSSLAAAVGPLRPTETMVGRRLYRPGATPNDNRVHGLQLLEGAAGSVIGGLTLGGFNNGAAIFVRGAGNVLIQDVILGRSATGAPLSNKIGVEVQGPVAVSGAGDTLGQTTIRRSTIVNSSQTGILLGTSSENVRVVGNTIGVVGQGNAVGITLASQSPEPSYVGAASGLLTSVTSMFGLVESIGGDDVAVVRFVADPNSAKLAVGYVLLETTGNVERTIDGITFHPVDPPANNAPVYRARILNASRVNPVFTNRGPLAVGQQYEFQIGAMAESGTGGVVTRAGWMTRGDTEIRLPIVVNPGDVFLGQEVSSPRGGFAAGTTIIAIRTTPPPAGETVGETFLTLSRPIQQDTRGLLLLGRPNPNLLTGNSDGIVVDSNASRIVNTVVSSSVFDGIRVERSDADTGGVHTFGNSQGINVALNPAFVTSSQNLVMFGNQLAGIRFTRQAFAALGGLTGGNTTPGGADPERAADYAVMDTYLSDRVRIRGNIIGVNPQTSQLVGNGRTGVDNVVIDLAAGDPGFTNRARINFLLLSDTAPQNGDPARVSARLRANVSTGLDSQSNLYGDGSPILDDRGNGGDTSREPTPPRRPIVRG